MMSHPSPRRDPLNDVMPYEMLKAAHGLIARGQNENYWASTPVPFRPVGRVRFEVARQVATFVVPLFGLAWAWYSYGPIGLLLGLPVAWLVGFLLDKQLDSAIDAQCRRDMKLDAGRYRASKWLCEQMGLRPEELTLDVIRKMDKDYVIVQRIVDEKQAKYDAAQAAEKERVFRRWCNIRNASGAAYGSTAAAAVANYWHDDDDDSSSVNTGLGFSPAVNPATGMPMIEGTFIDAGGSVFGQDNNNF